MKAANDVGFSLLPSREKAPIVFGTRFEAAQSSFSPRSREGRRMLGVGLSKD